MAKAAAVEAAGGRLCSRGNLGRNTVERQQERRVEHHEHHEARIQAGSFLSKPHLMGLLSWRQWPLLQHWLLWILS